MPNTGLLIGVGVAVVVVMILMKVLKKEPVERSKCQSCGKSYGGHPAKCPHCGEAIRWKK